MLGLVLSNHVSPLLVMEVIISNDGHKENASQAAGAKEIKSVKMYISKNCKKILPVYICMALKIINFCAVILTDMPFIHE